MAILEFLLPEDSPDPCPMACGGLTEDAAGGPCKACWAKTDRHNVETCWCDDCDEARAFDEVDRESTNSGSKS